MRGVVLGLEAIAVLVPDFHTLGLLVPAIFSVYRCTITLGFPGNRNKNAELLICLVLGYAAALALNVAGFSTVPAPRNHAPVSHRASRGVGAGQVPAFDQRYPE